MKNFLLSVVLFFICVPAHAGHEALPVPKQVLVKSAEPLKAVWGQLNENEKELAYHLIEAARAGRDILFFQNHRHALVIKEMLERGFAEQKRFMQSFLGEEGFQELLRYAAKFEDAQGPYAVSNRKYLLEKVSGEKIDELLKIFTPQVSGPARSEIVALLTDPNYEVLRMPEDPSGHGIEETGGNLYEKGITSEDIRTAIAEGRLLPPLNSQVRTDIDGKLYFETFTVRTSGPVGEALQKVVKELRLAQAHALNEFQRQQISYLIRFFEKGEIEDFRQSSIAWVKSRDHARVDFMMGFVEVYEDFRAQMGSWESVVQIIDPVTTQFSTYLAKQAQYFEDQMPYGEFKKQFPPDYFPPALMVYYFQEISSMHTSGYNLPNFDDIRKSDGFKNVIRLDLRTENGEKDPKDEARKRERMSEFLQGSDVELAMKLQGKARETLVLLHEIIGHGSGTYDESKYGKGQDPISGLGSQGSALEEQRSDLTALVFANDPKLIEIGRYADATEAQLIRKVMYDTYLWDFLVGIALERTVSEAHARGNWLLISLLLEKGAIAWVSKDGSPKTLENQVLAVQNYDLFQNVSRDLLAELQRIKANRDVNALKKLFDEKAPLSAIQEPWAQAIIGRGEKISISDTSVNHPWKIGSTQRDFWAAPCESVLSNVASYWISH